MMPNYWTLTLCCFFVGHEWPDLYHKMCLRCGMTEKHLMQMKNRWFSYLCMGPGCFLRAIRYESKKYIGNIACKYIGHRIKESWRYHGKLDLKQASLIALGENEVSRIVEMGIDVKKRRDQLMDDGLFRPYIFCERCQKVFGKPS